MPMVQIFVPTGSLTPEKQKLMISRVTDAVVEAEGIPQIRAYTNVIIVETAEAGWGIAGQGHTVRELAAKLRSVAPDGA